MQQKDEIRWALGILKKCSEQGREDLKKRKPLLTFCERTVLSA
jgi:hypothetical protein